MSAVLTERLVDAARAVAAAPWGGRTALYDAFARELNMSRATLIAKLKTVSVRPERKQRTDAGQTTLTRDEALTIAALIEETRRLTGSGALPLEDAVEHLRRSGKILAGRIDEATGEFKPLSLSAIRNALRQHRVHPDQLAAPTPAAALSSPHPNWCWQIDASVSRQFYLAEDGARVMAQAEFYRGKPQNFAKINDRRLWRYLITDHASGYMDGLYVLGSETTANLLDALIHVMCERPGAAMHGKPKHVMTDPGSPMTSGPTRNFCDAIDIELIINKTGNARAKGQVENAHWLVEQHFEAPLKLQAPVTSLEQINAMFAIWCRAWNATRVHSRTGMTRRDGWLRITPEQLLIAPPAEVLRSLATSAPTECTVRDYQVRHKGKRYDVSGVLAVINGQKLQVVRNPFDAGSVLVLVIVEDCRRAHVVAPEIRTDSWGFALGAAEIGTNHKAPKDTPVDANRKEIERLAMGVTTDAEALAKRKAKALPFGGEVDPVKHFSEVPVAPHIPRAGTPAHVEAPAIAQPRRELVDLIPRRVETVQLTLVEAAMRLRSIVIADGGAWQADFMARVQARYGDQVPEDRLGEIAQWLTAMPANVRAIGGGAA
jgi:hypothetical protein